MKKLIPLSLLALAACVEDVVVDGQQAFQADCAACHGSSGKGNGPLAAGLETPPPELTRIAARNGGIFPRDYVMSTIDGFDRGAHFSPAMPEFGAGDMGPQIMTEEDGNPVPVPARLLALTNYLQNLQE